MKINNNNKNNNEIVTLICYKLKKAHKAYGLSISRMKDVLANLLLSYLKGLTNINKNINKVNFANSFEIHIN